MDGLTVGEALKRGSGVVRDEGLRRRALERITALQPDLDGAVVVGHMECPVKGTDGNVEWLLVLKRTDVEAPRSVDAEREFAPKGI